MMDDLEESKDRGSDSARFPWGGELVEVSVFLFLIVPSLVVSFFVVKQGGLGFVSVAFATIARDLALVALVLYFLWRNCEPLRWIGWTLKLAWTEILLGLGLFIPFFVGAGLLENALRALGFSSPSTPLPSYLVAKGLAEIVLATILVVVVAVAEETIFRG
jgi:membrane protease YdiL (CAAX protease family)